MTTNPLLLATSSAHQAARSEVLVPADRFEVSMIGDVLIVEPVGTLDLDSMKALDQLLDVIDTPVVVNLRRCEPDGVSALLQHELSRSEQFAAGHVSVVCDRSDSPLEPSDAGRRVAVFRHTEDAIQALVLFESGFGDGWTPV